MRCLFLRLTSRHGDGLWRSFFVSAKELASVHTHGTRHTAHSGSGRGAQTRPRWTPFWYATMGALQKELLFHSWRDGVVATCPSEHRVPLYGDSIETNNKLRTEGGKTMSHASLYIFIIFYLFYYWWCTYFLGIDKRRVHVSRSLFWEICRCFKRTQWRWRFVIRNEKKTALYGHFMCPKLMVCECIIDVKRAKVKRRYERRDRNVLFWVNRFS